MTDISDDALYLQEWANICEEFIIAKISLREAYQMLSNLNERFKGKITAKLKKVHIIRPNGIYMMSPSEIADHEKQFPSEVGNYWYEKVRDGWMPSEIC